MLREIGRGYAVLLVFLALAAIGLSLLTLAPDLLGLFGEKDTFSDMGAHPALRLSGVPASFSSSDSPYMLNLTVETPPLERGDLLYLEAWSGGRKVSETDCLAETDGGYRAYAGNTSLSCELALPYDYSQSQDYNVYAVLERGDGEYYDGPHRTGAAWAEYEGFFWGASAFFLLVLTAVYMVLLLPIAIGVLYMSGKIKEKGVNGRSIMQMVNRFLSSPWFWGMEMAGISLILIYMFVSGGAWKSGTGLLSFLLSGLMAFVVPFLWCAAAWYAEFREREPLRLLVTFFLWGCLAALMAIGINSLAGALFGIVGAGFLATMLLAPIVEETFKGAGVAILAEHPDFNSVEDGIVFGFVVGMGFSFIENWIYLLQNPMGANIWTWLFVFILRSLLFSANHGFYTAITGGVIGLLRERKFRAPALGLIPGAALAATLHAAHNSGEFFTAVLGVGGLLAYCCVLLPLVDYGGLLALVLVFAWAVLRKKKR